MPKRKATDNVDSSKKKKQKTGRRSSKRKDATYVQDDDDKDMKVESLVAARNIDKVKETLEELTGKKHKKNVMSNFRHSTIPQYKSQLRAIFRIYDEDGSGSIDRNELKKIMRATGMRPLKRKIDQVFKDLDIDNNGSIDMEEFVDHFIQARKDKEQQEKEETKAKDSDTIIFPTAIDHEVRQSKTLLHYYSENAAKQKVDKQSEFDGDGNPRGSQHDLGNDDGFTEFRILILKPKDLRVSNLVAAIKTKGFGVTVRNDEKSFLAAMEKDRDLQELWIFSSHIEPSKEFVDEVEKFHNAGKGVAMFADGAIYEGINPLVQKLLKTKLFGNFAGDDDLKRGRPQKRGKFVKHMITTGINTLYEGNTLCFPERKSHHVLQIAESTNGKPCILVSKPDRIKGRVFVHCSQKQFVDNYDMWDSAGTERLCKNVACWLLDVEHKNWTKQLEKKHKKHKLLKKSESFTFHKAKLLKLGIGWVSDLDLDASCHVYGPGHKLLDTIYYDNLISKKYGISHSGDIISKKDAQTESDDEVILINLDKIPKKVSQLMLNVSIYNAKKNFGQVEKSSVRIVDAEHNLELCRYNLTHANPKFNSCVVASIQKKDGKWELMPLGELVQSDGVLDIAKHHKKYLTGSYVPPNATSVQL